MQTKDQYSITGLGRKTMKSNAVTMTLSASASLRLSVQEAISEVRDKRNDRGNSEGKPIDLKPWPLEGKKSTNVPTSVALTHPPRESLIRPLWAM